MITPFRDKIVEVLGQRLNYCWNSVNDTTKALIADELVKIITSDRTFIKQERMKILIPVEYADTILDTKYMCDYDKGIICSLYLTKNNY